jgi:hypothetical protein
MVYNITINNVTLVKFFYHFGFSFKFYILTQSRYFKVQFIRLIFASSFFTDAISTTETTIVDNYRGDNRVPTLLSGPTLLERA